MEQSTAAAESRRRGSEDRSDTSWLNWTTVRGVALVLAGATIMVGPREKTLIVTIGAVLFAGWAVAELWFALRRHEGRGRAVAPISGVAMGLVLVAAAVMLILDHLPFSVVVGSALVARGVLVALNTFTARGAPARRDGLLTALMLAVFGAVVIIVPDTAVLAMRAGLGIGAMALGGIVLSMGLRHREVDHRSAPTLVNDWLLNRRLAAEDRADLIETLFFEPPGKVSKLASFWVMMVLATGIASFAIIQDSTAVVIGAMLVAPLMTPIMGVSASAVNGWPTRLARSLLLVVVAAAAAVALAWLIASWLPSVGDLTTNTQIASRVEPSLLDFCIAVFAGAAGAYATVDPRVSSSLSGVAIAVALVPPLSVVGITLEQGAYSQAQGALLLFSTNVVSIVLAAVTVFVLMGFAALPPDREQREHLRRVVAVFGAGALVILVPLSLTSEDLWTEAADEGAANEVVDAWLPGDGSVQYQSAEVEGERLTITLSGEKVPEDTDTLLEDLTDRLGYRPEVSIRLIPSTVTELD
ncbi:MAG: DUF389 domain-containing protein [Microthrixaceae bacterium]